MTRNQIFASAIGGIIVSLAIGSTFLGNDSNYHDDEDDDGYRYEVNIDTDVDGDEIVIKTMGNKTVVFTKDGKFECQNGQDSISVTRDDGSVTVIACD